MFIVDPTTTENVLKSYPNIRSAIENPFSLPVAKAFPGGRIADRQLFRVLSNLGYEHLQRLVDAIERSANEGVPPSKLLLSREQSKFQSGISELFLARHFLDMGASVSGFDDKKANDSVPEFVATLPGGSIACEMYAPRDWEELRLFEDELRLTLLHLDVPFDFEVHGRMELLEHFNPNQELVWFNPWQFSEENQRKEREARIAAIVEGVKLALNNGTESDLFFKQEDLNVSVNLKLRNIRTATGSLPDRLWVFASATLTGYSPELMFKNMVTGKLKRKLQKRQAGRGGNCAQRALFVDVGYLAYPDEFSKTYYRDQFDRTVREQVSLDKFGLDLLVFCWTRSTGLAGGGPLLQYRGVKSERSFLDGVFGSS